MAKRRKRKSNPKHEAKHEDRKHNGQGRPMTTILLYALPILGGLLLAAAGMIYTTQKIISIWMFFAATVMFGLAICLYWQQVVIADAENPPFSIVVESGLTGKTRDSAVLFCEYNPKMLSPIPVALFIRIVNLQPIPVDISELKIELELTKPKWIYPGSWIEGKYIPDYMPLASLVSPPSKSVRLFLVGPSLQTLLESRAIQPHETVRGWVLIDMPSAYDSAVQPLVFRITVNDTAGHKFIKIHPTDEKIEENVLPERGFKWESPLDLSGYSVHHLIDVPKPT
jgi:hypothetical protein